MMGLALMVAAGVAGRFDIDGGRVRLGVHAVLATAVALAVALVTRWWLARRFRGLTVATLGAVSEVATVAVLLVLAARLPEAVRIRLTGLQFDESACGSAWRPRHERWPHDCHRNRPAPHVHCHLLVLNHRGG